LVCDHALARAMRRGVKGLSMFDWIYDYPPGWIAGGLASSLAIVTWAGILIFRPRVHRWLHAARPANEMVVAALNSFAVVYGILIGLIAVEVYQNYSTMGDIVSKEASSLSALYRDITGFPQPLRAGLEEKLSAYAREVVETSWPLQRRGIVPRGETTRLAAFYDELLTFDPKEKRHELLFAETLKEFNALAEHRRTRLNNIDTGIPPILWWVVLIGGAFHIVLVWLFDMEKHIHLILGGMLSAYIGLVTAFIAVMDRPFRGEIGDGPAAIEDVLRGFRK
jgi:hypothetical protein